MTGEALRAAQEDDRSPGLDEARARWEMVEEIANIGSWVWDLETGEVSWSSQLWSLLGMAPDTVEPGIASLLQRVVPAERPKLGSAIERSAVSGRPFVVDHEIERPDGVRRYVSSRAQPIADADGQVLRIVFTMQDMTERLITAKALRDARLKAEAAVEAKGQFLAQMSHEIRTPLNAVLGFTGLLAGTQLDERQRHHVRIIGETGRLLLAMLNDLLDLSKIEAGKISIEHIAFRLMPLLETARDTTGMLLAGKPVRLELILGPDLPEAISGDPTRLKQLLSNLLSNAVKFTSKGCVTLEVRVVEGGGGRPLLRCAVTDTGIGIPRERQGQLFQRFIQASDSTTRMFGGTGLGLAICRELVQMMDGRIGVDSEPGHGSTFWFELPYEEAVPPDEAPISVAAPAQQAHALEILVVDDVDTNRELAQALLSQMGHRVRLAANGIAAIEAVRQLCPDLVLMDVHMPEMDGLEATRAIRRMPGRPGRVPILALTASAYRTEIAACRAAGMSEHLMKPLDPPALLAAIARHADPLASQGAEPQPAGATVEEPVPAPVAEEAELLSARLLDGLEARLGRAPVGRLILRMLQRVEQELPRIEGAIEAGDARQLRDLTHRLAGLCGSLGATGLTAAARRIEQAAEEAAPGWAGPTAADAAELRRIHAATTRAFDGWMLQQTAA